MSSQLETNLVSVERVKEYSDEPTEVGNNEKELKNKQRRVVNKLRKFSNVCRC